MMRRLVFIAAFVGCDSDQVPNAVTLASDPTVDLLGGKSSSRWTCETEATRSILAGTMKAEELRAEMFQYEDFIDEFPAGRIDRHPVSCREYRACVDAGRCPPTTCRELVAAFVSEFEEAVAYCEWRGGTLPTLGQWQRAVLGPDGKNRPPFTNVEKSCWIPTGAGRYPRCAFITLEGVVYFTRSDGEWTRSSVCGQRIVVDTYDHSITRLKTVDPAHPSTNSREFRCVYPIDSQFGK
jgi:hypothetical protein